MKKKAGIILLASGLIFSSLVSCSGNSNNNQNQNENKDDKITKITCSASKTELEIGEETKIITTFEPNKTKDLLTYESSNEKVVKVDVTGKVTAISEGTATVTITCNNFKDVKATLEFTVKGETVTKFDVSFPSDTPLITEGVTTLYKLIVGKTYELKFDIEPKTLQNKGILAEYSNNNVCEFDEKALTLKPISGITRLDITFKLKGTNASKKVSVKILTQGESDSNEARALFDKSSEVEAKSSINGYGFSFKASYFKNGIKNTICEKSTLTVHKDKNKYYMSGIKTTNNTIGDDVSTNDKEFLYTGYGSDEAFYKIDVNENGTHVSDPVKKQIISEGTTGETVITTSDAIKQSKYYIHNSRIGLSEIAKAQITVLPYDYFVPGKSLPYYFGGDGLKHAEFSTEGNVLKVKTYQNNDNNEVFVNTGTYTFNDEGLIVSAKVVDNVFNYSDFDFDNNKPKDAANEIATYEISYTQTVGELTSEATKVFDTNNLYFKDYTPRLLNNKNNEVKLYNVGETYKLDVIDAKPVFATTDIDDVTIVESSNPDVVQILEGNKSIKVLKDGSSTLTLYSSKGVEKTITVMTKLPDATGIKAKIEGKAVTGSFPAIKGKAISNITFNVEPSDAKQDINVEVIDNKGTITKETNGTYTFVPSAEGKVDVKASAVSNPSISVTISFDVASESTTLSDLVIKNSSYIDNDNILVFDLFCDCKIKFIDKEHGEIYTGDDTKFITYSFTPVFNDKDKTIKFTNVKTTKTDSELLDFMISEKIGGVAYPLESSVASISSDAKKIENVKLINKWNDEGELVKEECKNTYTFTHVA